MKIFQKFFNITFILLISFTFSNCTAWPAVAALIGLTGKSDSKAPIFFLPNNHYWILEEFYKTHQTTEQIAEQAKLYKPTKVYADPAEPDRIEILRKSGLNCRDVSKDIVAGVDRVRELFKQGRIHISADCKNLIHELETYRYPEKKPDQNEQEKPTIDAALFIAQRIKDP